MGVMMQTFHWDCPREEKKEFQGWNDVNEQILPLVKPGFTLIAVVQKVMKSVSL